jgi:hypothetical protein
MPMMVGMLVGMAVYFGLTPEPTLQGASLTFLIVVAASLLGLHLVNRRDR